METHAKWYIEIEPFIEDSYEYERIRPFVLGARTSPTYNKIQQNQYPSNCTTVPMLVTRVTHSIELKVTVI